MTSNERIRVTPISGASGAEIGGVDLSNPHLFEHATMPERTCRFRWQNGTVAFRDDRCAQHCAVNDYQGQRRVAHRVTIGGYRPRPYVVRI